MTFEKTIKSQGKKALIKSRVKSCVIVFLFFGTEIFLSLLFSVFSKLLKIPDYIFYFDSLSRDKILPSFSSKALWFLFFFLALSVVLLVPLFFGIKAWHYSLTEGCSQNILNVFYYFSSFKLFGKSMTLFFAIAFRVAFWAVLFLAVPFFTMEWGIFQLNSFLIPLLGELGASYITFFAELLKWIVLGFGGFLVAFLSSSYFVAPYYLICDGFGAFKSLSLSKMASKGERWEIFKFKLSFIFYDLAGVLLIPQLYCFPYKQVSLALYGRFLIERLSKKTKGASTSLSLPLECENKE